MDQPQREALCFEVDYSRLPPHLCKLVKEIQDVAEGILFHWKTFPLVLPPRFLAHEDLDKHNQSKPLSLRQLFEAPSWDDLDVVSVDSVGEPRKLSGKHLSNIKRTGYRERVSMTHNLTAEQLNLIKTKGEFCVESSYFPGQYHVWRLSPLLQHGTKPSREMLLLSLGRAAALLTLATRERIDGEILSLKSSCRSLKLGLAKILDCLIGLPSLKPKDLERRLNEERSIYLVAELVFCRSCQDDFNTLCSFVRHALSVRQGRTSFETDQHKLPPVPLLFRTPKELAIDLRLFSKEIMDQAKPFVENILRSCRKHSALQQLIEESKHPPVGDQEKEELDQNFQRVFDAVLCQPELTDLGAGIPELLVHQANASALMKKTIDKVESDFELALQREEARLRKQYPVLSRVDSWRSRKLTEARELLEEEYRWKCHEEAIEACRRHGLHQIAYFLTRDLTFLKERLPTLRKELSLDRHPTRTYIWKTWIWNPKHWVVRRQFEGKSEIIATVLSTTCTTITSPRSDARHPVFELERSSSRTTTCQHPFWRWSNFLERTYSWVWNCAYVCGFIVPWCSPLSLRAVVCTEPFYADMELSQVNGAVCPRRSTLTPTFTSRLKSLWRHISKARTHFETTPDTGFMGRGVTRQLDRLWNYGVKGVLGTLALTLFFPLLCLLCTVGGICLAVSAPVWVTVAAFLYHLGLVLIYDADNASETRSPWFLLFQAVLWDVLIGGILQPVAAIFTAAVLCPIAAFVFFVGGSILWALTRAWDSLMFSCIIQPRARVPAEDGCLVKRIAGPGFCTDFFYQITKEQALAAFESRLETDQLTAYQRQTERLIRKPAEEFRSFVEQVFGPFSATFSLPDKNSSSASTAQQCSAAVQLERETQSLLSTLQEKVDTRLKELKLPLSSEVVQKVKMTSSDLKLLLLACAAILRDVYPERVLKRLGLDETELWERYNLEESDWLSLAAIFLSEIFSPAVLKPLQQEDIRFPLNPSQDVDLSRYTAFFAKFDFANGITLPDNFFAAFDGLQRYPDWKLFDPTSRDIAFTSPPWKKARGLKINSKRSWNLRSAKKSTAKIVGKAGPLLKHELLLPLPIPHPARICLLIYNRHRDMGSIDLNSENCRLLLRWLEGQITSSSKHIHRSSYSPAAHAAQVTKSPASHRPLLGSSGSDLGHSAYSINMAPASSSPSQDPTVVSEAADQAVDGTLSLVGTLVSDRASLDFSLSNCNVEVDIEAASVRSKSTLAHAADTLRAVILGKPDSNEEHEVTDRRYSSDFVELAVTDESEPTGATKAEKRFPSYQPATFVSKRLASEPQLSPRPLGVLDLSTALAIGRGPALSPAQLSLRKRFSTNSHASSGSQESLPFAEEDVSLAESLEWDPPRGRTVKNTSQPYCEVTRTMGAALASSEDLSLGPESEQRSADLISKSPSYTTDV